MFQRGQEVQDCLGIALPRISPEDDGDYQMGSKLSQQVADA